ncbi:MAG: HAD-IIIA family hydrolase [Candidatus Omnitrophota bacterium]
MRLLVLDVDGVLTDGRIIYDSKGNELKFFNVKDGFGIALLGRAGIKTCIVTAKGSPAVVRRAKDMGIAKIYKNMHDKLSAYKKILKHFKVTDKNICFIGDDLLDLPLIKRAGFAVTVKDGVKELKQASRYVTRSPGGKGAVREVAELILKSKGLWNSTTAKYAR